MIFIPLKRKINSKKVLEKSYMMRIFKTYVLKFFPKTQLENLSIELVRNFRGKFRNMALKYQLFLVKNHRHFSLILRGRINSLYKGPKVQYDLAKFLLKTPLKKTIPSLVYYITSLNLFLYQEIKGETPEGLIGKKPEEILKITPKLAVWLRKFHSLRAKNIDVPQKNISFERSERRHWLFLIKKCAKESYSSIEAITERLWRIRKSKKFISPLKLSLIHGDFHWGNIIKEKNNNIKIVDFSNVLIGDPLEDVGSLISQTESMFRYYAPQKHYLVKKIINSFLKNYFPQGMTPGEKLRINYFEIQKMLQMIAILSFLETDGHSKRHGISILISEIDKKMERFYK